jgi:hypothetical protein
MFLLPPLIAGFNSCDNYPDTGGMDDGLELEDIALLGALTEEIV